MKIIIETERLVLRPMSLSDLEDLYELHSPDVMRYIQDGRVWTKNLL